MASRNSSKTAEDFVLSYMGRLFLAIAILVSLGIAGTIGFHYIEGWAWFDSFYMTLTTMATVGYGEIHPLSHVGRIFNSFLIVASVIGAGFTVVTFSQALLEFEFGKIFGRRRMEQQLAKLSEHYIICGAGRVGRSVARELCDHGQNCVIIEKDPTRARWAEDEKIPVIIGDASSEDVLSKARIDRASGFVAAVNSDAETLYIILTARGFRSDLRIIARASEEVATSKLLRAGASEVISPYFFVGRRIAQLFLRPNVLDFIDTAFGTERLDIEIGEVKIPMHSLLVGRKMSDSIIRQQAGVIVLAVKNAAGNLIFNPPEDSIIRVGDCLIVIGGDDRLKKLEALANAPATVS